MSEVCREMTRPEVYRSWKATGSRWKCANSRRRSSATTPSPNRPISRTNARVVMACTPTATKNAAMMAASGATSRLCTSGGMPRSMATPTSHGPVRAARFATTTSTSAQATWRR